MCLVCRKVGELIFAASLDAFVDHFIYCFVAGGFLLVAQAGGVAFGVDFGAVNYVLECAVA